VAFIISWCQQRPPERRDALRLALTAATEAFGAGKWQCNKTALEPYNGSVMFIHTGSSTPATTLNAAVSPSPLPNAPSGPQPSNVVPVTTGRWQCNKTALEP
jgi:hypothetical protein